MNGSEHMLNHSFPKKNKHEICSAADVRVIVINLRVGSFFLKKVTRRFPEIFLKKMRVYRVKKANDRQMAPFGRGVASPWLRRNVVGVCF